MRQPELRIKRARGFLLIVAILMVVVVAVAIVALGYMTSADIRASSGHAQSEQAYFAAQSGIEVAIYQFSQLDTPCASLVTAGNTNVAVGAGRFTFPPPKWAFPSPLGGVFSPPPPVVIFAPPGKLNFNPGPEGGDGGGL